MSIVSIVIRWLGQACFLITTAGGTPVLIDPPHPEVGYAIRAHSIPAKLVLVSHNHFDHNFTDAAVGAVQIVEPETDPTQESVWTYHSGPPGADVDRFPVTRIFAYHDNVQGKERGPDTITVLETGGIRIVHLEIFGQLALTDDQVKAIGRVDVLMIPVGGTYTIDGPQAAAIVAQLHPRVILPMHYQTPALNPELRAKLAPPDAFLAAMAGQADVVRLKARDLVLTPGKLPAKPTIYILRYQ